MLFTKHILLWVTFLICGAVRGQAGDNNCKAFELPDTILFEKVQVDTVRELRDLGSIEIRDTFDNPFGILFYNGDEYIALRKKEYWIYWKVSDEGYVKEEYGRHSIFKSNIDGKKGDELILLVDRTDGRYTRFGGGSESKSTLVVYKLEKPQLVLSLPVYYHYESSVTHYSDVLGNVLEEEDLQKYEANDMLDDLTYVTESDSQTYTCQYAFEDRTLSLRFTCAAVTGIGGEANFTSTGACIYAIKPTMLLRKSVPAGIK